MDCSIIFYSAKKTSLCEKALKHSLSTTVFLVRKTSFSTDSVGLADGIKNGFKNSSVVFVIGGTRLYDERKVTDVVSKIIDADSIDECKKLKNNCGDDGFLLRAGGQFLILLPDEPEGIEDIMRSYVVEYINKSKW